MTVNTNCPSQFTAYAIIDFPPGWLRNPVLCAAERERLASERLAAANSRASAAAAALEEVRARVGQVQTQLEEEQRIRAICEGRARTLTDQLDLVGQGFPSVCVSFGFSSPTSLEMLSKYSRYRATCIPLWFI